MSERIQGSLCVQRVEAGLEQQQIHSTFYKSSDLNLERLCHLVE